MAIYGRSRAWSMRPAVAQVQSSAPEPGAGDTIIWQDDFDAVLATTLASYAHAGDITRVTGRGGSGGALHFAYYNLNDDNIIDRDFGGAFTDIYFRYWYRAQNGWLPYGGITGSGMKWFMPWRDQVGGHQRYTMGVGQLVTPNYQFTSHDNSSVAEPNPQPSNIDNTIRFNTTNDANWHKYTLHVVTGNGGYEQIWIDDVKVLDNQASAYDHDSFGIISAQGPGLVVDGIPAGGAWDGWIEWDDYVVWHK